MPIILITSVMSLAAHSAGSAESRFYAGVGVGRSSVDGRAQTPTRITLSPNLPSDIPIGGLPFDDHATAESVFVGYTANSYVGVRAGFWNHGTFDSQLLGQTRASVSIKEWYFGATLSYPLFERLALSGSAGLSRAHFDADGALRVLVVPPGATVPGTTGPIVVFPPNAVIQDLPLDTPADETGGYWSVGLNWRFSDSLQAGVEYGRRDLQVLQVKTLALSLRYAF